MSNDHHPLTKYFVDAAGLVYSAYPKSFVSSNGMVYTNCFKFLMVKNSEGQYEIEINPDYSERKSIDIDEFNHWLKSGDWEEINFPFNLKPQFEYLGPERK